MKAVGISQKDLLNAAAKMPPARARLVLRALAERAEREEPTAISQAAEAFEADMQPVRNAIAEALHAGDLEALRGLRAMLPTLLAEVNESPELAEVLAYHVGKTVLEAMGGR